MSIEVKTTTKRIVKVQSPGRINLIGEHIDYNGGLVMPAAIHSCIYFSMQRIEGEQAIILSENLREELRVSLSEIQPVEAGWKNYILGVLFYIDRLRPGKIKAFRCEIDSRVPIGAGLSSSAALECGFAKAVNLLFDLQLTDIELIKIGRDAEHFFVGTKCGIMDQFAVVKGRKDHFLLLDSASLDFNYVSADLGEYRLILLNTNVSHNLASSEYNTRRRECEEALAIVQEKYPETTDLAGVSTEAFSKLQSQFPVQLWKRAKYVMEEQQRVKSAHKALHAGDMTLLGNLLYASHKGLQHEYEVSCTELDFLVDLSRNLPYVAGARMMGGGFGGCTLNLVHHHYLEEYEALAKWTYQKQFNRSLTTVQVAIGEGVKETTHDR